MKSDMHRDVQFIRTIWLPNRRHLQNKNYHFVSCTLEQILIDIYAAETIFIVDE